MGNAPKPIVVHVLAFLAVLVLVPLGYAVVLAVLDETDSPPSPRPVLTVLWVVITLSLSWWHHTRGADSTPVAFDRSEQGYYRLALVVFALFGLLGWWFVETAVAGALLVVSFLNAAPRRSARRA